MNIVTPDMILAKWANTREQRIERAISHLSSYVEGIDMLRPFLVLETKSLYVDEEEAQIVVAEFRKRGWDCYTYIERGRRYIRVAFKKKEESKPWWKIW